MCMTRSHEVEQQQREQRSSRLSQWQDCGEVVTVVSVNTPANSAENANSVRYRVSQRELAQTGVNRPVRTA